MKLVSLETVVLNVAFILCKGIWYISSLNWCNYLWINKDVCLCSVYTRIERNSESSEMIRQTMRIKGANVRGDWYDCFVTKENSKCNVVSRHFFTALMMPVLICSSIMCGGEHCRWTACKGQQFPRPIVRITWQPYSMKAYAQMNLLSKWVNNQWERRGVEGKDGQLQSILLSPACSHQL